MKHFIILLTLFIPLGILAQNTTRSTTTSKTTTENTERSSEKEEHVPSVFSGLSFSPDYVDFIYKAQGQRSSVRPRVVAGRRNPRNNIRAFTPGGEDYYFFNTITHRNQPVSIFNDREFVQWDHNGLYALKNDDLLISRDGGRRWQLFIAGLYGAIDVQVSPNGRAVAYTVENHTSVRTRSPSKALLMVLFDDINNPLVNVLKIAQDVPRRDLPYTPNVEQGVNDDFFFTADSRMLYFTNKRTADGNSIQSDIFKYDTWAKQATNLTAARKGYNGDIKLSPDGSQMAWLTTLEDQTNQPTYHLMVLDLITNKQLNATVKTKHRLNGPYIWGEKHGRLYFISTTHLGESIFILDIAPSFRGALETLLAQSKVGDFVQLFGAYDKTVLAEHFNAEENKMELVRVSNQNGLMKLITAY